MHKAFHVFEVLFIAWHADHDRFSVASCAACTANAVDVVLGMAGHVEVEHVAHGRHVEAACRYIGGDKEPQIACAKAVQSFGTLALIQIAVNGGGVIAVLFQGLGDSVHIHLAVAEDDSVGALIGFGVDQRAQYFALFCGFAVFA